MDSSSSGRCRGPTGFVQDDGPGASLSHWPTPYTTTTPAMEAHVKKETKDDDDDEDMSYELVNLIERVRMSLYRNDDITPLFAQYEEIKRYYKKGSMSTVNLSMG